MKDNFDHALQLVLVHEGGFSNHPQDPGGATMKGVTLAVFQRFFGADKGVDDLRNITNDQLAQVYRTGYWDVCQGDQLPVGVDYATFDLAVNSGPGRAARFLQSALGLAPSGPISQSNIDSIAGHSSVALINSVCDQRLAFLQSLKTFPTFGKGWTRRVAGVRQQALDMANSVAETNPAQPPADQTFETVRMGSVGEWVSKLQTALEIQVDGKFGPGTDAALRKFQQEEGLTADGIAGRNTYRALGLLA